MQARWLAPATQSPPRQILFAVARVNRRDQVIALASASRLRS